MLDQAAAAAAPAGLRPDGERRLNIFDLFGPVTALVCLLNCCSSRLAVTAAPSIGWQSRLHCGCRYSPLRIGRSGLRCCATSPSTVCCALQSCQGEPQLPAHPVESQFNCAPA